MVHRFQLDDGRWVNVWHPGEQWLYFGNQFKPGESLRLFVWEDE